MTRDQIIEKLFTGQNFRDAIAKMEPTHLQEDLRMEVMLEVCEWSDDKVIDLHDRGKLGFYVAKVMLNMLINKYSPFYKKFRAVTTEWSDDRTETWDDEFKDGFDWSFEADARRRKFVAAKGIPVQVADIQQREIKELREDRAISAISKLHWYDQELVNLYLKLGSYRAIEEETRIPWESAYKTIQKALKELKEKSTQ